MSIAKYFIGGEWVEGLLEVRESFNPASGDCHTRLFAEGETGGYRQSGLGRLHGVEGLNDFLETKHVYLEAGSI
ncbi:MAG: hypothetical protein JKX91_09175 [Rhizobiaceae bacterium]|nr:hypothetical protein [Rhizobiaceae bacterium]